MQETPQIKKSWHQSLEREILDDFQVSKYQIRYLLNSLTSLKPHYEILKYYKITKNNHNYERYTEDGYSYYRSDDSKCIWLSIQVYDQIEKKNRFLQIYLLNTYQKDEENTKNEYRLFVLQNIMKKVKSFGNYNLILQPLDSYLLYDEKDIYSNSSFDCDFFIVEFESFDYSYKEYLSDVCQTVNNYSLKQLIDQQFTYCKQVLNLDYLRNIDLYDHVYLKIEDSQKIKIKINLIPLSKSNEITLISDLRIDKQFSRNYQEMNRQTFLANPSHNYSFSKEKRRVYEEYSRQLEDHDKLSQFVEGIDSKMNQSEFTIKLPTLNSLKYHQTQIFNVIAENLKYKYFEVLLIDEERFVFNITFNDIIDINDISDKNNHSNSSNDDNDNKNNKNNNQKKDDAVRNDNDYNNDNNDIFNNIYSNGNNDNDQNNYNHYNNENIHYNYRYNSNRYDNNNNRNDNNDLNSCVLEGKKCKSFEQAKELQQQYEKLIGSSLIQKLTTITSSELIKIEKEQFYILLERNKSQSNLTPFVEKYLQSRQLQINYLEKFIQLSYTLFKEHSIQITTIHPYKIIISEGRSYFNYDDDYHEEYQLQDNLDLQIEDFNEGEYSFEYIKIFQTCQSNYFNDIQEHVNQLFQSFFESVSGKNVDQFEIYHSQISALILRFKDIARLDQKAQQLGFNVQLSFVDSQLEDISMKISSFNLNGMKSFQQLLKSYSIVSVQCRSLDQENIIKSRNPLQQNNNQRKQRYYQQNLSSEKQDVIQHFFSSLEISQEQEQNLVSSLKNITDKYQIELNVRIENYSLKFQKIEKGNEEEDNPLDLDKEGIGSSELCLILSFSMNNSKDSNDSSCLIKILQRDNQIAFVLSEHPLIVQYSNSIDFSLIDGYFLRALWYQYVSSILPEKVLFHENYSEDISFLLLSILQHQKGLKEFSLHLNPTNYQLNHENYNNLFTKFVNLQSLNIYFIPLRNNREENRNILDNKMNKIDWIIENKKLKELANQLRSLNTLTIQHNNENEKTCSRLYSQLIKTSRLVHLDYHERNDRRSDYNNRNNRNDIYRY